MIAEGVEGAEEEKEKKITTEDVERGNAGIGGLGAVRFTGWRWYAVYGYVAGIALVTPWLPELIRWASRKWTDEALKRFVLGVEVGLGALLLVAAGGLFFWRRERFWGFGTVATATVLGMAAFYLWIPNPYGLTHLPEYAVLSGLVVHALRGRGGIKGRVYLRAFLAASGLGGLDEVYQGFLASRYLEWYDVGLNVVGCGLGVVVYRVFGSDRLADVSQGAGGDGLERR